MSINPFHWHCGPFNRVRDSYSSNYIDNTCREHDIAYGNIQKNQRWVTPYITYNKADEVFIEKLPHSVYAIPFKIKKKMSELVTNKGYDLRARPLRQSKLPIYLQSKKRSYSGKDYLYPKRRGVTVKYTRGTRRASDLYNYRRWRSYIPGKRRRRRYKKKY